jgi:hypothetical protein
MGPDARDEIAEALKYGQLKPKEAEARLLELGLPALAPQPDPAKFNPMGETWWTLPMALAWIAWRSPREVLEAWDPYRTECSDWHLREWREGPGGPAHVGYFSEQREPATMMLLIQREENDRAHSALPEGFIPIREAEVKLWKALSEGALQASGVDLASGERVAIHSDCWRDLEIAEERKRAVLLTRRGSSVSGQPWFEDVVLRRHKVMEIWQPSGIERYISLPATIAPEGGGYMPLYCAAQWIATRGGTFDFDPSYLDVWKAAYRELLARIASNDVAVIGVRAGVRGKLDGHLFAGIRVSHPFADTPFDLIVSDELYLSSSPYIDEEHWDQEFNDSLEDRRGRQWSKLMVLKSDIGREWPFEMETSAGQRRSGAPGRPTSIQLVWLEYEARWQRSEVEERIGAEAEALSAWLAKFHPKEVQLTPKTIRNTLGAEHRRRWSNARK